jgi:hypothetical protein
MVQSRCNTYWKQCEDRRDTIEVDDFVYLGTCITKHRWIERYKQDRTDVPLTTRNNEANRGTQANKDKTI